MTKGTKVILETTNGGYSVVTLTHDYKPTYAVTVLHPAGHTFTVMAGRIKSVRVAA